MLPSRTKPWCLLTNCTQDCAWIDTALWVVGLIPFVFFLLSFRLCWNLCRSNFRNDSPTHFVLVRCEKRIQLTCNRTKLWDVGRAALECSTDWWKLTDALHGCIEETSVSKILKSDDRTWFSRQGKGWRSGSGGGGGSSSRRLISLRLPRHLPLPFLLLSFSHWFRVVGRGAWVAELSRKKLKKALLLEEHSIAALMKIPRKPDAICDYLLIYLQRLFLENREILAFCRSLDQLSGFVV